MIEQSELPLAANSTPAAPSPATPTTRDTRPSVVVVTSNPTPYRHALHARIDREIPEIRLLTVYTHAVADQPWALREADPSRVASFGMGDALENAADLNSLPREWGKGGRIIRWMSEQNVRAAVVCGYNDPARLRILRWCRRRALPAFLFTDSNVHADYARGLKAVLKRLLIGTAVRASAGVMVCGRLGTAYFKRYGVAEDRVFLTPYEPDYRLITDLPQERIREAMRRFGLAEGRKRIVFCARLVEIKRPDRAIDAFAAVAAQRPDFDLVIIGDGPMRGSLEARVPPGLRDRVLFTGFLGDQADIAAISRASDVFIHPSVLEPWGVVINEAVAAGLAVVATNVVGAAEELVRDGVNGQRVPPDDPAALAAALLEVTDPARLPAMRAASAGVLAEWRRKADPVEGLRRALERTGVIPPSGR